jgi:hypothetical protein
MNVYNHRETGYLYKQNQNVMKKILIKVKEPRTGEHSQRWQTGMHSLIEVFLQS